MWGDMEQQVISKHRVATYGEVLTGNREVKAMLDLVKQETERIDSRFLEPACGTGNFLAEILERKLAVVENRYKKNQYDYERYAVLAVSSIYGIDILEDNVQHCRQRLFSIFDLNYLHLYSGVTNDKCRESVSYILERNIIHGNALTLMTIEEPPQPIIFSEWSLVNGSLIKRRDFSFCELMSKAGLRDEKDFTIFDNEDTVIPNPLKDYPPIHFLKLNVEASSRSLDNTQRQDDVATVEASSRSSGKDNQESWKMTPHRDDVATQDNVATSENNHELL